MARIEFSREAYNKIKNSSPSEEVAFLLEKFNPNRPFKGQKKLLQKTSNKSNTISEKITKRQKKKQQKKKHYKQNIQNEPKVFSTLPFSEDQKKEWMNSSRRAQKIIERNIAASEKLKKFRKKSYIFHSSTINFVSVKPTRTTQNHVPKRTKQLFSTKGQDAYNFAGEYSARNVEHGHGRRKSLEWNDSRALDLEAELKNLHKLQEDDPNTFDRFAIK